MSVGLSAATVQFMGDSYTFIDCPGSIEFAHDMRAALPAVDDPDRLRSVFRVDRDWSRAETEVVQDGDTARVRVTGDGPERAGADPGTDLLGRLLPWLEGSLGPR